MLGSLIGGFIVIFVGITLIPIVADKVGAGGLLGGDESNSGARGRLDGLREELEDEVKDELREEDFVKEESKGFFHKLFRKYKNPFDGWEETE